MSKLLSSFMKSSSGRYRLRDVKPAVRKLWSPRMSATVPEAASAGSLVQKLANESVSNLTSTLPTALLASAAISCQNLLSSSEPVQKKKRSETVPPVLAGACWAAGAAVAAGAAGGAGAVVAAGAAAGAAGLLSAGF